MGNLQAYLNVTLLFIFLSIALLYLLRASSLSASFARTDLVRREAEAGVKRSASRNRIRKWNMNGSDFHFRSGGQSRSCMVPSMGVLVTVAPPSALRALCVGRKAAFRVIVIASRMGKMACAHAREL